jgi:hypothetical protein
MEKVIFRREEKFDDNTVKVSIKKPVQGKRKDMTPVISLFSNREKSIMTRKFFNNDANRFTLFMDEINTKMTWYDAFNTIEKGLANQKVDILSEEVQQLTTRIYNMFFPDDISISR